ncbi:MAG: hypothetical protein OEW97_03085 [Gammaproteobacteria bacterium]|nr:hypothetical protein [Gammaproteobacteria bacterium]
MSELDIKKWLSTVCETVKNKDLDNHMNLVSEKVMVYGLPNGQTLTYEDWKKRRKSEFQRNLIKNLAYEKLKIKNIGLRRLIFNIEEIMDATNNDLLIVNKNITIEYEPDNQWRVVEENIQKWKYLKGKIKASE